MSDWQMEHTAGALIMPIMRGRSIRSHISSWHFFDFLERCRRSCSF